ncbi:MAG: hypothetical protein J5548_15320 [Prevotella sp.]|nr:hypothetical protein [Prevotella sp.]
MTQLKTIMMTTLAACLLMACGSSEDFVDEYSSDDLYAIVIQEGVQPTNITPGDYVLTFDNIIAVNPETGEFKVKNTERIDSKAFPMPTNQHLILFYSKGCLLFEAKLNSVISSYLPSGLTFCHFFTDKNGLARYDLGATHIVNQDGKVEGMPNEQQQEGMQRMYQILKKAGKTSNNIEYDFQFE